MLVLASGSPRRRELLERVGYALTVESADVDETPEPGESPDAYVRRLAVAKAEAVRVRHPQATVIGADTTVTVDGDILGKAGTGDEARAMLARLTGRSHRVMTGWAVVGPKATEAQVVTTEVVMRQPSAHEIDGYITSGEWRGKAGAYAVQGMAAAFVTEVRGSITSVIGLPLAEVVEAVVAVGGPSPDLARGVPA